MSTPFKGPLVKPDKSAFERDVAVMPRNAVPGEKDKYICIYYYYYIL